MLLPLIPRDTALYKQFPEKTLTRLRLKMDSMMDAIKSYNPKKYSNFSKMSMLAYKVFQ
jgi:hypothetical protein